MNFSASVDERAATGGEVPLTLDADFHGWEGSALRDDINFDLEHLFDLERVAMVGDKNGRK
jgi:hypothetical protein